MPQAAYPVGQDVINFFQSTGLVQDFNPSVFQTFLDFNGLANNAKSFFEILTNRRFLAAPATRNYAWSVGTKGVLSLGQDLCSDPSVEESIVVVIGTKVLTLNQDFVLGPDNADNDGKPWQWIQFTYPVEYLLPSVNRKPISVTGSWGYSLQVPDDVWTAALQKAAADACPQLGLLVSQGLIRIKEGDYEAQFGGSAPGTTSALSNERLLWSTYFNAVVAARKRVVI